jgi:tetratricopeptide (TPR) repeat protein
MNKGEGNMAGLLPAPPESRIQANKINEIPSLRSHETQINDPFFWNEYGNEYFKNQAYTDAIIAYNKAIEIEPTYGQPYNNLALVHFIQGNYNESILQYRKCIILLRTDQEKAVAWNGLGNVYRCKKDYEAARLAYQKASELDEMDGGVDDQTINVDESENYKTADFWNDLGKLFFKNGNYEKATAAFREAIKLKPSSWPTYEFLARSFTAQGQYEEAASTYCKSIDLIPNDKDKADAWNRLGDVYRKLNDYDNALNAYKSATKLTNGKFSLVSRTRFSLLSNCSAK